MKSQRTIIKSKLEKVLRNFKKAGLFGSVGYVSREYRLSLLNKAMSYARRRLGYDNDS